MKVWKTRSVFWELPYWKFLRTPHSLDIMHITKNVSKSLVATIINMLDRTKDGPKARHDLICLGKDWELSKGAKLELDVASSCGIKVLFE